jgi:hypothetical protein
VTALRQHKIVVFRLVVALFALLAAPAGIAAEWFELRSGESVTVRVHDGQVTIIDRSSASAISAFEMETLRRNQGIVVPPNAETVAPQLMYGSGAPAVVPGQIRITFRNVPGTESGGDLHSLLTLENGYGQSVLYRAVMHKGTQSKPTDVCEIIPGKFGFEYWPYKLDSLDLSDFRFADVDPNGMRCQ